MRLDTYENEEHMEAVRELLTGTLANTAFAVYAPDGETVLTKRARSPNVAFGYGNVESGLKRIADKYPGRKLDEPARTPDFTTVREAINLASCDERPLVLGWCATDEEAIILERQLRALAWDPEFVGAVHWDITVGEEWRSLIPDAPEGERGVIVVESEPFGRSASVLASIELADDEQQLALRQAKALFDESFKKLDYDAHVDEGHRLGVKWAEPIRMHERNTQPTRRK